MARARPDPPADGTAGHRVGSPADPLSAGARGGRYLFPALSVPGVTLAAMTDTHELAQRVDALEHDVKVLRAETRGWAAFATSADAKATAASELLRFVYQDVQGIREVIDGHTTTLEKHSGILTEHSAILAEHSGILAGQSAILEEHSGVLAEHSAILAEHSGILAGQSAILEQHSGILAEHSGVLAEHSGILHQHTGLLEEILRRLPA